MTRRGWLLGSGGCLSGGLLLLLAGCGDGTPMAVGKKKDEAPPLVTVAKPTVKTVTQLTDVLGTLQSQARVEVRPQVSGYIEKVNFKDGQEVKAGDVLVTIESSIYKADFDRAQGELQASRAKAKQAAADEARVKMLYENNSVSVSEYDKALAEKLISEANILISQANVDRAAKNLEWTKVVAKINGRVDRIFITEGNLVSAGTSILTTLSSTDPIYGYFEIDEETVLYYLKLIAEGKFKSVRERKIPFDFALKGEDGYQHHGELDFASTELNAGTGTLTLRAVIPNPAPYQFTSGMFIKGRLPGAEVPNAILVPDNAIVFDQDRKVVFTVNAENRVVVKPVQVGPMSDGLRVVLSGLEPTDTIIVRGLQRVRDGSPVEAVPAKN